MAIEKLSIERIYHPYWLWEETQTDMWVPAKRESREGFLKIAIDFTGNHKLYGHWMNRVIQEWTYSCEHNLSNLSQNRRAWLGHAACAHAHNLPEDIVREAWSHLTEKQQIDANKQADNAIEEWERSFAKKTAR